MNIKSKGNRGGARKGAGRKIGSKKSGELKIGRIVISCLKSEENCIKKLAKEAGMNVSQFIINSILKKRD